MDQAVKAALDKYLGKKNEGKSGDAQSKGQTAVNVLLVILIVCTMLFCGVKFNVLGLGNAWTKVRSYTVGEQTVGQVLDGVKEKIDHFFDVDYQANSSAPINTSGESGSIENENVDADNMNFIL